MAVESPFAFSFRNYPGIRKPSNFLSSGRRIVLPVTPEKFEVTGKSGSTTVSSIAGFTFSHAAGLDLEQISFEGFFPADLVGVAATDMPDYVTPGIGLHATPAKEPSELVDLFSNAMAANQPVYFSVTQGGESSEAVYEETSVTISSFTYDYSFGNGMDVHYSMSLQRWYPHRVAFKTLPTTYVTRSYGRYRGELKGDKAHCHGIAHRLLGDSSRAGEIRRLNSAVIKADHKKRIHIRRTQGRPLRLYEMTPGLVLKIPAR